MTGGRPPKQKGNREERRLVEVLRRLGIAAERVPMSGSVGGKYRGDINVPLIGKALCCEVKIRSHDFTRLYDWLVERDLLIVRANHQEALVVLRLNLATEIALIAERRK